MNAALESALQKRQAEIIRRPLAEYAARPPWDVFALAGLECDLSRNYVDAATLDLWEDWWTETQISAQREALRRGEAVNRSENRAALHFLLRQPQPEQHGEAIQAMRRQMQAVAARWQAEGVRDVIHIGIGGSELGARLLCEALYSRRRGQVRIHFLSSPDPERLHELQAIPPQDCALIVASKSFHTEEVLFNARVMAQWLRPRPGRMLLLSANPEALRLWPEAEWLPLWDWVGGRFSLSSALALPLVMQNGYRDYEALLQGMAAVDAHFFETPLRHNLPVLLATLDVWYRRYFDYPARAIIGYSHALRSLPAHLQQLVMESLGKSCSPDGEALSQPSGMMIWGGGGTDAQHSFFQWLHQGTQTVPLDMITLKRFDHVPQDGAAQRLLHSHCIAQMSALLLGQPQAEAQRRSPGNRPSTAIILERLNPYTLGTLCALYEHKTSVEALLYGINAYDQWGVEQGKRIAEESRRALEGEDNDLDAAGQRLAARLR